MVRQPHRCLVHGGDPSPSPPTSSGSNDSVKEGENSPSQLLLHHFTDAGKIRRAKHSDASSSRSSQSHSDKEDVVEETKPAAQDSPQSDGPASKINSEETAVIEKDGGECSKAKQEASTTPEQKEDSTVQLATATKGNISEGEVSDGETNEPEPKKPKLDETEKSKGKYVAIDKRAKDKEPRNDKKSPERRQNDNRDRDNRRNDDRRHDDRRNDRRRDDDRKRRDRGRTRSRSRSRDRYRRRRSRTAERDAVEKSDAIQVAKDPEFIPRRQQKTVDILTSKTGGAYIPPAKLRLLQAEITDKASAAYQRIAWEALKKSIHGFINKVNVDNIGIITRELLKENIIRGRGLLSRSIIQAQAASPTFSHVYAALVSVINSKFPNIGELLLHRLVIQFKRGFRRNDKTICISSSRFIAHLINQRVAHEILALEILTLLVQTPTDDSVEVAIAFLKECGMKLQEVSAKGVNAIFEMLKNTLHEGKLDKRVQYMIEVVFQVRKDGFKDHIAVQDSLELVEEDDQYTHLVALDEATDTQDILSKYSSRLNIKINIKTKT